MENLTQEKLKRQLYYNPLTGEFKNKIDSHKAKADCLTGYLNGDGYLQKYIAGKKYYLHRLAFLYMEGYFPENDVDHRDQNPANNKWENLREVNRQCNMRNTGNRCSNTSGVKGVSWFKRDNKWRAFITVDGKTKRLGHYEDFCDAVDARLTAEQDLGWAGCESNSPAHIYMQTINVCKNGK